MKEGFAKIRDTWIFKIFCAVFCAAAGTTMVFLVMMVMLGRISGYHGQGYQQITAIATERIAKNRLGQLLNTVTNGNWPDSQAVLDDPEGPVVSRVRMQLPEGEKAANFSAPIEAEGVHDLYLIADGPMTLYAWIVK